MLVMKISAALLYLGGAIVLTYYAVRAYQLNGYFPPKADKTAKVAMLSFFAGSVAVASLSFWTPLASMIASAVLEIATVVIGTVGIVRLRTRLKFTPRATRLFGVAVLVLGGIGAGIVALSESAHVTLTTLSMVLSMHAVLMRGIAAVVNPLETRHNRKQAMPRYAALYRDDLIRIGITGSFGKTGCKEMLAAMLAARYRVVKTEGNFNTPIGIAKAAESVSETTQIFIAEMGAKRKGEIAELTEIVRPRYAIVTGVAPQHLDSFGTAEAVYRTKKELPDRLPPDGFCVYNGDNDGTLRMYRERVGEGICAGERLLSENTVRAKDVEATSEGLRFTLLAPGRESEVFLPLLGRHNVVNFVLAATLAMHLGVTAEEIVTVAKTMRPVPHRLEIVRREPFTVIDDSYNANVEGVRSALEALKLFDGRKIVLSQGIVELGREQTSRNEQVGRAIAEVADVAMLIGKNSHAIARGLRQGGMRESSIVFCRNLKEAEGMFGQLLQAGDVLLLQNDLP